MGEVTHHCPDRHSTMPCCGRTPFEVPRTDRMTVITELVTCNSPAAKPVAPLRVGDILYGYCSGYFGRGFWGPATVEAIGSNWVVARRVCGDVYFYEGSPERLTEYREPEKDDE